MGKEILTFSDIEIEKKIATMKFSKGYRYQDKEIQNVDSSHTCLAVISFGSALKKDRNYYPHVFLKECKQIEKKVMAHVIGSLSYFSSSNESDEKY